MLSFKTCLSGDKDLSYPTQDEDPCAKLFEQYMNQDPINFGDPIDDCDGFQAFDFAFDEETESSESCSADSKHISFQPIQQDPPTRFSSAPIQEPSPVRIRSKHISGDVSGRSISSTELLTLEGRVVHHGTSTKESDSPALPSAVPTLRRKSKFCTPATGPLHGRSQRVAKAPSAEMIHPSHKQDNTSYNEWTQRFEQISIQTPTADNQSSPPRDVSTYRDKRPSKITTSFNQAPQQQQHQQQKQRQQYEVRGQQIPNFKFSVPHGLPIPQSNQFDHAATAPLPQEWQNQGQTGPSPISNTDYSYTGKPPLERSQTQGHLQHPSSWDYGPVSPLTPEFISPNHVQPQWLHNLHSNTQAYNENGMNLHQTPSVTTTDAPAPDVTSQDLGGFQYSQFVNEDPSNEYSVLSPDRFFAHASDPLSTPLYNDSRAKNPPTQPRTPPPRSHSTSPKPHHGLPTPSKTHLRSKSNSHHHNHNRRPKSLSALKSPRSATHLKSARSARELKSSKSMSGVSSSGSKSSASGGNGSGGSGSGFGFVNFTEADRGKILTGVAPSGSSKTKARREQEAMDKKRRMSMAAMRAIEEAGGDVERLREVVEFEC